MARVTDLYIGGTETISAAGLAPSNRLTALGPFMTTLTNGPANWTASQQTAIEMTGSQMNVTCNRASHRVLVCYSINMHLNQLSYTGARQGNLELRRDDSGTRDIASMRVRLPDDQYTDHSNTIMAVDHPNTESTVTYSLWTRSHTDASVFYWQHAYAGSHPLRGFAIEINNTAGAY